MRLGHALIAILILTSPSSSVIWGLDPIYSDMGCGTSSAGMVYGVDYSQAVFDSVSDTRYLDYVVKLTENGSRWTRIDGEVVFSDANSKAQRWIARELMDVSGGKVVIETLGRHRSVVGVLPGWNSDENAPVLMVGGHYDSVPGAPGANDDASGIAAMLELARVMSSRTWPLDIYFCAWNSEEIGLLGSSEVAGILQKRNVKILQYYNLDMLLVEDTTAPPDEMVIAFYNQDTSFHDSEYYALLLKMMSNNLGLGIFNAVSSDDCPYWERSDHASFLRRGYDSVLFLFDSGIRVDSSYHQPSDTWDNQDYNYDLAVDTVASIGASMAFTMGQCYGQSVRLRYTGNLEDGQERKFLIVTTINANLSVTASWLGGGIGMRLVYDGAVVQSLSLDYDTPSMTALMYMPVEDCSIYELIVEAPEESGISFVLNLAYESDVNGDGVVDSEQFWLTEGLFDLDSDGDSLSDADEILLGTDRLCDDTDDDMIDDGWEILYGLNPLVPDGQDDCDNDGVPNVFEYYNGTSPVDDDTDSDSMPDLWELENRLNPLVDDSSEDPDNDGLTNLEEYLQGSDPKSSDLTADVDVPMLMYMTPLLLLSIVSAVIVVWRGKTSVNCARGQGKIALAFLGRNYVKVLRSTSHRCWT